MRTFGFGAVGRAGKASFAFALLVLATCEEGDEEAVEGEGPDIGGGTAIRGPEVPQAVRVFLDAERNVLGEEAEVEDDDSGGKALSEEDNEPFLPIAEREDWAVEDFNRKTRLPPPPPEDGDIPGMTPPGPGRAG